MRTYRELFAVREFRTVFVVRCLTMAATSASSLALGTITYAATGKPVLSGLAMFGGPLVRLVASWFLLAVSDLLSSRVAMGLTASAACLADLLQAVPGMPWGARLAILSMPWAVMGITGGAAQALVADALPERSFVFGKATLNIAVGGMQIIGFALGGVLLLHLSTTALFLCAAGASLVAVLTVLVGIDDRRPRAVSDSPMRRTRIVNLALLRSPLLRPVYLACWVPNGLIVGCESLFVPLVGEHAGYIYSAAAAGMLFGDIMMGRFVPDRLRQRLVEPLRVLLAAPYVFFLLRPSIGIAMLLGFLASAGYSASLPLQERLIGHTDPGIRGQVLGLQTTGLLAMQGIGAVFSGLVAGQVGGGSTAAATAIGITGCASLAATAALTPGLRRTRGVVPSRPVTRRKVAD